MNVYLIQTYCKRNLQQQQMLARLKQ